MRLELGSLYEEALISELKNTITEMDAVKVSKQKDIKLSSGKMSNFYLDIKRVALSGKGAQLIARILYERYRKEFYSDKVNFIGRELGAVPILSAASFYFSEMGIDTRTIIVKKQPKAHGIAKWIEGVPHTGANTTGIIIDDVMTTGNSLEKTWLACVDANIMANKIYVIVDREESTFGGIFDESRGIDIFCDCILKKSDFKDLGDT